MWFINHVDFYFLNVLPFSRSLWHFCPLFDSWQRVKWMTCNNGIEMRMLQLRDFWLEATLTPLSTVFLHLFIVLGTILTLMGWESPMSHCYCHCWCISLNWCHTDVELKTLQPCRLSVTHTQSWALVLRHSSFLWYRDMFWPPFVIWAKLWQLESDQKPVRRHTLTCYQSTAGVEIKPTGTVLGWTEI